MGKDQKSATTEEARGTEASGLDRRRPLDTLRESEYRLRLALDSAEMGTWVWNLATDSMGWDERQYRLFGITPEEFSGRGSDALRLIHSEDREQVEAALDQALREGKDFRTEFRVMHPGNQVRWLAGRGHALAPAADGGQSMIGVNFDITEHKQIEKERANCARLEDRAQMHRLHMAGELAALLAHQLNQPLAAIRSFAEAKLARLRRGSVDPEQIAATLQDIVEQSERAAQSIRDLRKFLARQPQELVAADLNAEVSAACKLMEVLARRHKIRIVQDLAEPMPRIPMRPAQIEQIIVNLMENAMDAISGAGHRNGTIEISTALDPVRNQALVLVQDSGPGLDAEAAQRVFEPLYTTKKTGIGMGLVISRSIIEGHGGRIWAEPGKGGRFLFSLPISQ